MKRYGLKKEDFGQNFRWGTTISAFQNEGAANIDGKGPSIWDIFERKKGSIKTGEICGEACNFYNNYRSDIELAKEFNFNSFGFSVAWSRIIPEGKGQINQKGVDFYNKVIDTLLEKGIDPWVTLYHWDLPQALQNKGGWVNRDIVNWFSDYTQICTKAFGDRVKNYKVLNEPSAFTGFGYMTGEHAPGHKSLFGFLAAAHHANLCQAEGGRIVRDTVKNSHVGTSFATFSVQPKDNHPLNVSAAKRIDATINRMFIEPAVGLGYPYKEFPAMKLIEMFFKSGDDQKMKFDFDFLGIQYYCRLVGQFSLFPLIAFANEVPASQRNVPMNNMGFEIYPEGMYDVLKRYQAYPGIKKLLVTECGVCLDDEVVNGEVNDPIRIRFYEDYLYQLYRAKQDGVNVEGFFTWTLFDNFEWWEGYKARFGLVYVNHKTQQRIVKQSGYWLRSFLNQEVVEEII
ncbi:MAG: GH1 family beta-glucosidase [Bacteroidota bacterium]|nr:GH1 family beta-glucosidase [Bacteroidota bacterium]